MSPGNAKLALEDYTKCLQIRKSLLPNSDRRIAEVFATLYNPLARCCCPLTHHSVAPHADTM